MIGHVSADNYLAQVSGQAPNEVSGSDCISNFETFAGSFEDVDAGDAGPRPEEPTPARSTANGCVYRATVQTIGDQLEKCIRRIRGPASPSGGSTRKTWATRPHATTAKPDPLGGTDCAHPAIGEVDVTNTATEADQYADRHNPFIYFHSVIDDKKVCDANVVPLGSVEVGAGPHGSDAFSGHLGRGPPRPRMDHAALRLRHAEPVQRRP